MYGIKVLGYLILVLVGIVFILLVLFVFAACKVSGEIAREEEIIERNYKNEQRTEENIKEQY